MWTPEKITILKKMWSENYTAREISEVLGCSRNAVIGKKHRLKLQDRVQKDLPRKADVRIFQPKKRKVIKMEPEDIARKKLLELKTNECKWPVGDQREESFGFCGLECEGVYCQEHKERAYRKCSNG